MNLDQNYQGKRIPKNFLTIYPTLNASFLLEPFVYILRFERADLDKIQNESTKHGSTNNEYMKSRGMFHKSFKYTHTYFPLEIKRL